MPVTFGGMASGLNTDDIIRKLVEVEAQPIRQWEEEKFTFNKRKEALGILKQHLAAVNDTAKDLYGFRASYADKKSISSDPDVVEATANKFAENGVRKIEVLDIASTHRISTDALKSDQKIEAGKFKLEVNGLSRQVRFRGGSLKSLQDQINDAASDIVTTSYVNTVENQYLVSIESKVPGKKGEIKISGDRDLLYAAGLIKGEKGQEKETMSLVFDSKYFVANPSKPDVEPAGAIEVDKDGKWARIKGMLWREYVTPLEVSIKKTTIFEFKVEYSEPEAEKEEEALPYRLEIGPEEKTVIKGIDLNSYNVSRIRPIEKKEKKQVVVDVLGVGVVSSEKDARYEKIYPIDKKFKGKMEIPIGRDFEGKKINRVIFYCNTGSVVFSDASMFTPIEGTGLLEPKNEIAKPNDARLKIDGIEVVRDKNDGISDALKGVTLNLRSTSDRPVNIKIEPDIEKSLQKIRAFVDAYNKYLEYEREITKSEKSSKAGEYQKNKYKNGLFLGDMTILRLENSLKSTIGDAYPSRSEKPIKVISQMGVSTGAVNAAWETIREGKLVIDEGVLATTLKENPDAVEEFFGSDTDGDNRIDNGMAYRVEMVLRPYIGSGKNIIASKVDLEDNNIKSANDRIERQQEHLKRYEEKLRKKFATMEQSISGAKSQGEWMKNQMKGAEGDSGK